MELPDNNLYLRRHLLDYVNVIAYGFFLSINKRMNE